MLSFTFPFLPDKLDRPCSALCSSSNSLNTNDVTSCSLNHPLATLAASAVFAFHPGISENITTTKQQKGIETTLIEPTRQALISTSSQNGMSTSVSTKTQTLATTSLSSSSLSSSLDKFIKQNKLVLTPLEIQILLRLSVAVMCGAILGVERRAAKSTAGLRTFSLVSLGSALFMITALVSNAEGRGGDPARMAASVATGVGFLGAGTISRNRKEHRGLTTAAGIWIAASLGIASAYGFYLLSFVGAIITTLVARYAKFEEGTKADEESGVWNDRKLYNDRTEKWEAVGENETLKERVAVFVRRGYKKRRFEANRRGEEDGSNRSNLEK